MNVRFTNGGGIIRAEVYSAEMIREILDNQYRDEMIDYVDQYFEDVADSEERVDDDEYANFYADWLIDECDMAWDMLKEFGEVQIAFVDIKRE